MQSGKNQKSDNLWKSLLAGIVEVKKKLDSGGRGLARDFLRPGDLVIVAGELGVGKTQLVKGIARGLGLQGEIKSPSFSLIHEYKKGDFTFYHLDFYRLEEEEEVVDLGWEEYREDEKGIMVVEWGDKFPTLFSPPLF